MTSQQYQKHILIVEDDRGRKEFILDGPVYSLGRDPKSDIYVRSLFVSHRHATLKRVTRDDGSYSYQIFDGDGQGNYSTNGLLINGQKHRSYVLQDKDKIIFGYKVQATYFHMQRRDTPPSGPLDPFDVTLIDPRMVEEKQGEENPSIEQPTSGQL